MANRPHCQIIPPYLLEAIARSDDAVAAERARQALATDDAVRAQRSIVADALAVTPETKAAEHPSRLVSDAKGTQTLPGVTRRGEGDAPTRDAAVNEAYDGLGATWQLYWQAFGRNSLDGQGMALPATVHYGKNYDNAFWDGTRMVFGDGDGRVFTRFTAGVDVIGHELTHGVTEVTAGLVYRGQSGALNESLSDVFGSLVKQHAAGQTAGQADWLIGAGLFTSRVNGRALRDMLHPGTAYDDPTLGKDPQPSHMDSYVHTTQDNQGVHLNSGIPNRAFALAATAIGGYAWEGAGAIWYEALTGGGIRPTCDFATFAGLTSAAAARLFGAGTVQAAAVADAWTQVGVVAATTESPAPSLPPDTVALTRSGGFTGITKSNTLPLESLPAKDEKAWRSLLGTGELTQFAEQTPHPDAFTYDVTTAETSVCAPENALPSRLVRLFERFLDHRLHDDGGPRL